MSEPKFLSIKRHILKKIETRVWEESSKIPSENQLAEQFAVSRMTARRALQELTEEGILIRNQGAGTFVACLKTQSSLLTIRSIADEIQARGHQHSAKVLKLTACQADTDSALALEVIPDSQIYYSQILHFDNQLPLQLEERAINPNLVSDYLQQDFTNTTPHAYLSKIAPLTQATHSIEAISATPAQANLLALHPAEPCLLITRRTWCAQGVVSVATLTCPGSRYRLDSQITL